MPEGLNDAPAAIEPAGGLTTTSLADGQVRTWEQEVHSNDFGRMYVLDVFGVSLLIRQREDGLFIHIDRDAESEPIEGDLIVEVNNGGENVYE